MQRSPNWVRVTQHRAVKTLGQAPRSEDRCNSMSDWDDLEGVTPRISNEDAERLLSGATGIDETHELADLSVVFGALRGPAEPGRAHRPAICSRCLRGCGCHSATRFPDPKDTTDDQEAPHRQGARRNRCRHTGLGQRSRSRGVVPTPFSHATQRGDVDRSDDDDDSTDETVTDDTVVTTVTEHGCGAQVPMRAPSLRCTGGRRRC